MYGELSSVNLDLWIQQLLSDQNESDLMIDLNSITKWITDKDPSGLILQMISQIRTRLEAYAVYLPAAQEPQIYKAMYLERTSMYTSASNEQEPPFIYPRPPVQEV